MADPRTVEAEYKTKDAGEAGDAADAADAIDAGDAGEAGDAGAADDGPDGVAPGAATVVEKPRAPKITSIMAMGGMHFTWTLNDTDLDSVEVWRKKDFGPYTKVCSLAGDATEKVDTTAKMSFSTYCYYVVNVRGGVSSDKSNEKCGSP